MPAYGIKSIARLLLIEITSEPLSMRPTISEVIFMKKLEPLPFINVFIFIIGSCLKNGYINRRQLQPGTVAVSRSLSLAGAVGG